MGKKILLVDDSSAVRMMTRFVFSQNTGYEFFSACDGKEGVEKAIAEKPDLILMDVEMPRLTGFEACRTLRSHPDLKNVPIILLTSRKEERWRQEGYDSGCNEYLTKPFDEKKLVTVLRQYLGE